MTLVVGLTNGKDIVMMADATSETGSRQIYRNKLPKIKRFTIVSGREISTVTGGMIQQTETYAQMLVGACGLHTLVGLLHDDNFTPPVMQQGEDARAYVYRFFHQWRNRIMKDDFYKTVITDGDGWLDGMFIVGFDGRLFTVHGDFQIIERNEPYAAIGSGEPYALGALCAIAEFQDNEATSNHFQYSNSDELEFYAQVAADAAALHSSSVNGPFYSDELIANKGELK